ncbi:MAG: glycosyltransferase, partial [Candidatus Thorarchaeota archaeon]
MVSRLSNLCGLYLGPETKMIPPRPDNPAGFWENIDVVELNDQILSYLGGGWDFFPPLLKDGWELETGLTPFRKKALELIEVFAGHEVWGWKDPRISLTLPFWKSLLPKLIPVVCLRNPLEVALSLQKRNHSSIHFGLNLWFTYNSRLIKYIESENTVVTHYDAYFIDPKSELERLSALIGLSASKEAINKACLTISRPLRHSRFSNQDLVEAGASAELLGLYDRLCKKAGRVFKKLPVDNSSVEAKPSLPRFLMSIIILTYNQINYTKKCIESILKFTSEPFELILIDNGSTDGTLSYLEQLSSAYGEDHTGADKKTGKSRGGKKKKKRASNIRPRNKACRSVKVISNEKNLGFAAGNNQGIAVASGDYILLINNDVVVTPGWLGRMISCAERNPKCGIVGPRSNYVSGPQLVKEVAYDTNTLSGLNKFSKDYSEKHDGRSRPIGRVVGFCMLIKRAVIDKIGGLDTRYGLGNFEDDDFSLRAALAGFESWIAEGCFVHHFGSRTFIGANIDYRESLNEKWEIFKEKWGMPKGLPYGSYDFSQISDKFFDPAKHYYSFREKKPSISGAGVSEDRDYEIKSAPRTEAHLRSLDKTITASIIVPVSKTSYNIRKCLDSINRHTSQAHEIIFVDLGTRKSTLNWLREISKKDSKYRLMENRKNIAKSCIRSYNEAINSSMGEYIVFLCDDLLVFEDWLSRMLECCNTFRDVGIVGPMTNFSRGIQGLPDSDHLELDKVADYAKTFGERNGFRRVATRYIDSFCMLLKRELVESIGLFDEELDSDNFAEDFCLRAALEGYRSFIAADVFIYRNTNHVPVPSKRKLNEKWSGIDSKSEIGKKLMGLNALEKAHKLSQRGDINKAVDTLLQSIGGLPEKKELYYALSDILIDAKQFKDAVEVLNEMPEDHEGEKGVDENTGLSESSQKDIKKLELLGYCKEGLLLYDDAQEIADRLLAFNPNHALALNLKGILAYRKGNIDAARSFFESAVSADPGYGEPYTNLGTLKWTRELREEAVDLYERGF